MLLMNIDKNGLNREMSTIRAELVLAMQKNDKIIIYICQFYNPFVLSTNI